MKPTRLFSAAVAALLCSHFAVAQSDDMTFLYEEPLEPAPYSDVWSVYISGEESFDMADPDEWSMLTLFREGKSADFRAELAVKCNSDGEIEFGTGLLYGTDPVTAEEVEEMVPYEVFSEAYDWRCLNAKWAS